MKDTPYLNKMEMLEYITAGLCAGELAAMARRTREYAKSNEAKVVAKWLQTAATYAKKSMEWRERKLDASGKKAADRRKEHAEFYIISKDLDRFDSGIRDDPMKVPFSMFQHCMTRAMDACKASCPFAGRIVECDARHAFTQMGVECTNPDPPKGVCQYFGEPPDDDEFKRDYEVKEPKK